MKDRFFVQLSIRVLVTNEIFINKHEAKVSLSGKARNAKILGISQKPTSGECPPTGRGDTVDANKKRESEGMSLVHKNFSMALRQ